MTIRGWLETEDGTRLEMELLAETDEEGSQAGVAVVCHPHPLYGGNMDALVVRSMAEAARGEGYAPLLFNFRGTGDSAGVHAEGLKEVGDVQAAVVRGRQLVGSDNVILMGYSFGAGVATRWLNGGGRAAAFVGVAVPLDIDYPDYGNVPSLYISGEHDDVAPLDDGLARSLMVDGLHVVVEDADHFFNVGRKEIAEAIRGFIAITCPLEGADD